MTPVDLFELVLALLAAALVLSLIASRIALPPAVALVLGGIALALIPQVPAFDLDPDLIMVLFLPPLLLASAYFTVWRDFRAQLRPILLLAVGAVAFTTFAVGAAAHAVMPSLPWAACIALGAIVSPPDAVSAKAVLQRLRIPRRLSTVLEGESLVNDASGLVLYRFAVAAAVTGTFSPPEAAASFVWLAAGGIGLGLGAGVLVNEIFTRSRDAQFTIVVSFLAAWALYILAERLHASGVLAVVACGLMLGWRQHEALDAPTRMQASAVWGIVVFVLEALVFVLIGLAARGVLHRMGGDASIIDALPLTIAVSVTVIVSRFVWVFPATYVPRWLSPKLRAQDGYPPPSIPIVVGWAGMRGVVSLAAALALPEDFPGRDPVLLATFGVILVTVLLQGTTLGPLIKAMHLATDTAVREPLNESAARVMVAQASLGVLEAMEGAAPGTLLHPQLAEEYRVRVRATSRMRDDFHATAARGREHFAAALIAVAAGRSELLRLYREQQVHGSTLEVIEHDLDLEEMRLTAPREPHGSPRLMRVAQGPRRAATM